jgi:DNA polymerase V
MKLDPATVRSKWSVVLERTVRELLGTPCNDLDHTPAAKQEIACTRSLGRPITEQHHLAEAVNEITSRAAEEVQKQHSQAGQVLVFIRTSPFRRDLQYSRSMVTPLRRPSADTTCIAMAALQGLNHIFRPGLNYAKAGVMLLDLQPDTQQQAELDLEEGDAEEDRSRLMTAMDTLNQRFGKGTVLTASAGLDGVRREWSMKQLRRTPAYTTRWDDLPVARA